jgi:hypothetical protein
MGLHIFIHLILEQVAQGCPYLRVRQLVPDLMQDLHRNSHSKKRMILVCFLSNLSSLSAIESIDLVIVPSAMSMSSASRNTYCSKRNVRCGFLSNKHNKLPSRSRCLLTCIEFPERSSLSEAVGVSPSLTPNNQANHTRGQLSSLPLVQRRTTAR